MPVRPAYRPKPTKKLNISLRVAGLPGDREGEVQGDRRRAHRRHADPQAEAGRHAVLVVQLLIVGSTVPVSQNTTPRSMSSAVMGNRYSAEASNSKSPPTMIVLSRAGADLLGETPRNWKPRMLEKPPA